MENRENVEKAGQSLPVGGSPGSGRNTKSAEHDIYLDPAIAQASIDDPILQFLQRWWRQVLYVLLAAVAITYLVNSFRDAFEENRKVSSDRFVAVDEAFLTYETAYQAYEKALKDAPPVPAKPPVAPGAAGADEKVDTPPAADAVAVAKNNLESRKTAFNQTLAEAVNQSSEPYKSRRSLYDAKVARLENDPAKLMALLPEATKFQSIEGGGVERLQSELLAMTVGRGLLDQPANLAQGRALLVQLAQSGDFLAVPAGVAVADISTSADDRKQALQILTQLQAKFPEQNDLLQSPIDRLSTIY